MSKNTVGYIVIAALLLTSSFFSLNLFLRQRTEHDVVDIQSFPHTVGDWRGRDLQVTEKEYRILETRNLISREYSSEAGEKINLFIIYSETNRSVFHPPEVCLIGSGVDISDKEREKINFENKEFSASKIYLEKDNDREVVIYCYKAGNFYTDNFYLQQAYFALNQLLGKHKAGATIRVSMRIDTDEEAALTALKSFVKKTIKIMEEFQPS